jgi:molybdate transport system ATP-binding protein
MSAAMQHQVSVKAKLGTMPLDASFTLSAPWTVLFGASGCGKTSILRAMGGVLRGAKVSFTRIEGDAQPTELNKEAPDCRALAYAPQAGAIFPHLTVAENVSFPYSVCDDPPAQATLVDEAISLFALHVLADRMPKDLSGGERQRVNLARAFATPSACLLLLDEPFAGLDRARRDELLPAMKQWCEEKRIQVISVTHDVDEALLLGADIVRIDNGKVIAQGPAHEVLAGERERMLHALR